MIRNCYAPCNKFYTFQIFNRYSALFINGPKATEHFVYLTPHIDFPDRLQHKNVIKTELKKRKSNIDFDKLENLWNVYNELKTRKFELDKKKDDVFKELEILMKAEVKGDNVEKLKIQMSLIKDNLRKVKAPLWSAEEIAIIEALKLPNILHPLTPEKDSTIIFEYNAVPSNNKDHLKIGQEDNLVHFIKNENYYLKGEAAIFELGAMFYFSKVLKQKKFVQFSNTDFAKSLVVEGCGTDPSNPNSIFILHENECTEKNSDLRLHLTGAGSIYSFFAYHTKNVLYSKVLPLQYFAMGRQYLPTSKAQANLFHVNQSSVVEVFIAGKNNAELGEMFENIIDITKDLYAQLGYHFRLSLVPANQLNMWESLRLAIEMYSSSLKSYVEIGNVSLSGDFISKRLMFTYSENKQMHFPHILSGTILNVPKLLACVLEQNNDFVVPQLLRVENWSIKTIV